MVEEPFDLELFGSCRDGENFDFILTNEVKNDTYLDLSRVPFKDQPQAIDDWTQSLSIIITNYKNSWSKEKFLDYIAATLQGDVLQWLRQ